MNTTLTREAILQSRIHHWTAALDYSGRGWEQGVVWRSRLIFCPVLVIKNTETVYTDRL